MSKYKMNFVSVGATLMPIVSMRKRPRTTQKRSGLKQTMD